MGIKDVFFWFHFAKNKIYSQIWIGFLGKKISGTELAQSDGKMMHDDDCSQIQEVLELIHYQVGNRDGDPM